MTIEVNIIAVVGLWFALLVADAAIKDLTKGYIQPVWSFGAIIMFLFLFELMRK